MLTSVDSKSVEPFPKPQHLPSEKELPDPLKMLDGKMVSNVQDWETKRKPELRSIFEHYMYGRLLAAPTQVVGIERYRNDKAFDGTAVLQEVELQFDFEGIKNPLPIRLLIATPPGPGPFPCFLGISFAGNHAVAIDEGIRIPDSWQYEKEPGVKNHRATAEGRGQRIKVWPIAQIVSRGYAVATFYNGDIQPDRPDVEEGMRKYLPKKSGDHSETGAVMSWAWGASRCMDYLSKVKSIDAKRVAIVGHSRLGKAALVAGAFDDRFAVVIPHQAGCGGSGPSRHEDPKAESVKRINTSFPHWFCGNFKEFNDDTTKLPFDQNGLVALCAPRPVLFTNAADDLWANPSGQFKVLKASEPAYKLYGKEGCTAESMPEHNQRVKSRLGYFIRPGAHSMIESDWKAFMDYADIWLKP